MDAPTATGVQYKYQNDVKMCQTLQMKLKAMNISLVVLCCGTVFQFRAQLTFLGR